MRASVSSTCVAQIAGTCAASHSQRISSCTSASRSKPSSTARSPRAIITATGGRRIAVEEDARQVLEAGRVSIFSTRPIARARVEGVVQRRHVRRASGRRTGQPGRRARATNARCARSSAVSADDRERAVGRLMPFSARSFATGPTCAGYARADRPRPPARRRPRSAVVEEDPVAHRSRESASGNVHATRAGCRKPPAVSERAAVLRRPAR